MLPLERVVVEISAESQPCWDVAMSEKKYRSWSNDLVHIADDKDVTADCLFGSSFKIREDRPEKGVSKVILMVPNSLALDRVVDDTINYLVVKLAKQFPVVSQVERFWLAGECCGRFHNDKVVNVLR